MTEVFKYLNGLSPVLTVLVFSLKSNYCNRKNFNQLKHFIPKNFICKKYIQNIS